MVKKLRYKKRLSLAELSDFINQRIGVAPTIKAERDGITLVFEVDLTPDQKAAISSLLEDFGYFGLD